MAFNDPRDARVYSHRARARHVQLLRNDSDPNLKVQLTQQQSVPVDSVLRKRELLRSGSLDNLDELNETDKVWCYRLYLLLRYIQWNFQTHVYMLVCTSF